MEFCGPKDPTNPFKHSPQVKSTVEQGKRLYRAQLLTPVQFAAFSKLLMIAMEEADVEVDK